jgi:CheY-like chemotaxis protein
VLLVEDSEDIQTMVAFRLKKAGHRVLSASSGEEALALVEQRGAPDVVVPAIFLSAKIMPQDVEAGRALGATYLTKPFVATALLNAVEKACADTDGW